MLDAQAWRASRLIVDSGMHGLGWSRQQSIDWLLKTGLSETDATIETDRYIAWPGQALTYMTGMREIRRLRQELEARDGAAFDLTRFHDELIGHGPAAGHAGPGAAGLGQPAGASPVADLGRRRPTAAGSRLTAGAARAGRTQQSKPIPSVSIARRNSPGGPRARRPRSPRGASSSTAGVRSARAGSGTAASGRTAAEPRRRRVEEPVAQDAGRPAARADAEPGVAQRVVDAAAQRLAERDVEPRRGVDRPAPAVGERMPSSCGNVAANWRAERSNVAGRWSCCGPTRLPGW